MVNVCGQTHYNKEYFQNFISKGKRSAREFQRALILLLADKGKRQRNKCLTSQK